jgi:hypothetical protein
MRKSFRLPLAGLFSVMLLQLSAFAYETDTVNRVVTLTPNADISKTTSDMRSAFSYLVNRADKTAQWTMKLNPGQYVLSGQVTTNGLKNTVITSADPLNPAQLIKKPGWDSATSAEYLLYNSACGNVTLSNIEFYGQTSFADNADPYWPDQGVYFGSCSVLKLDSNKFFNFGNAALRVATWERDANAGVNSFKTQVSNNIFDNFYQTSTTVQDNIHGGTAMSTWINNRFTRVHGSVKFASRTAGATNIEFFNNVIDTGEHFGLEINNYQNFNLKGNTIRNIASVAMNIYTGGTVDFPWGDNYSITNNTISSVGRGIRFSHEDPYVPSNLIIDNNTLTDVHDVPNIPAIWVTNGNVNGLTITNNKLTSIANQKYIGITSGSTNVNILNNLAEGLVVPNTTR